MPTRRRIGREEQPARRERLVERVDGDARLDFTPPRLDIHRSDAHTMARKVDDYRSIHALARQTRATAARQNRQTVLDAEPHRSHRIVHGHRYHHAQRFDLIDRRVGRIQHPIVKTDPNLSGHTFRKFAKIALLDLVCPGRVPIDRKRSRHTPSYWPRPIAAIER